MDKALPSDNSGYLMLSVNHLIVNVYLNSYCKDVTTFRNESKGSSSFFHFKKCSLIKIKQFPLKNVISLTFFNVQFANIEN